MTDFKISDRRLKYLYINRKFSTCRIAELASCNPKTVWKHLKKLGVEMRNKSEAQTKYKIDLKVLKELYWVKNLSCYQIAKVYGCSPSAIVYKFKKYNIPFRNVNDAINLTIPRRSRSLAISAIKYPKKPFSGDITEKAYLLGFASGDLHVTKNKYGATVKVEISTTKKDQVELVSNIFQRYTHIGTSQTATSGNYQIFFNLHDSFDFLLDYNKDIIPNSMLNDRQAFLSFLAGYIDAEGSFGVYNGRGSFFVGSYDKNILSQIHNRLKDFGIICESLRRCVKAGYIDKRGVKTKEDLWGFKIRRKKELPKFIKLIKPFLKHSKRINDLKTVESILNPNN